MNLGAYLYSDQIVLRMNGARVVDRHQAPQLYALVEELAAKAGLPMPKVAIIDDPAPNAFATGRSPERGVVAVTTGITHTLSPRELRGVLAHELAHIRNRDILLQSVAAVIASGISGVANLLMWFPLIGGGDEEDAPNPVAALALAIVAPIAATVIQLGISRSREYHADAVGAQISGDPEALASALLRLERGHAGRTPEGAPATASLYIVNPLAGVDVARWFSTHPSTADRVARLRAMGRGAPAGSPRVRPAA
jgi:heat shock protein HtpX